MEIQQGAPLVYVSFSAEIDQNTTENLINTMAGLANKEVKEVYLTFSTTGGQVGNGINLYNNLKGMPFELTIHNVNNVSSIGNAIFLAGKKRYAAPNATFMFHGVSLGTPSQQLRESQLKENLKAVLGDQKRIGDIISDNTILTDREIARLFSKSQTQNSSWALEKGIIHDIRDIVYTKGCPILSFVFKR